MILRLVEMILGMAAMYFGLDRLGPVGQARGAIYGVLAIAGLIVAVHGLLLFLVPGFFNGG